MWRRLHAGPMAGRRAAFTRQDVLVADLARAASALAAAKVEEAGVQNE